LEKTSLVGSFNARNVAAASLVAKRLGLDDSQIKEYLKSFKPAFGRGEKIKKFDKEFYVFLAKNPASFNNNLGLLNSGDISYDSVLFILNDKIPDGRDVSWIYDIEPVILARSCIDKHVYFSGTRYLDMQIRLDYADVSNNCRTFNSLVLEKQSLKALNGNKIVVLPNYSAMLEFRQLLTGSDIL
jgi:UDP-N-acetylmuramyl tripeptide synthase